MKKYGHIIWMAMVMLMGMAWSCCSSDDSDEQDVPVTGTPIAFSAKEGEETAVNNGGAGARAYGMTRAATPLSESTTTFKVWGYKNDGPDGTPYSTYQTVFPGYTVNWIDGSAATTTSNTNGWEYVAQETGGDPEQTIKYWDWGAKAYRFFGVTGGLTGAYGTNNETYKFEFTANASSVRDGDGTAEEKMVANIAATPFFSKLWFSTGNEADYPTRLFGKPVQLEFMKPFARVRFMFTYSFEQEGNKIKTKSFKPTDTTKEIALIGSFTVRYPLTGNEIEESYSVTPEATPETGETLEAFTEEYIVDGTEKWYTVLPIDPNNPQGSYTMTIRMAKDTEDKTAVVPAEFMQWKPGYSYTYIFKITEQGGVEIELVQSAFTSWTEMTKDHDVYNW
ncbi:hypothetical protein [uncultured Prevotella sp.]|uniref:hypothetical protein n=1 Tax=uncultured Prevotella sp. TaxID=159272 RepID=UPI0025D8168B|nr:hypothetical protein [uncultured Prevotella sp.]